MGSQRGGGGGGSLFFANSTSANLLGPPWGAEQASGRLRSRKLVKGETLFPWSVGFQRAEREGLATAGLGTATPRGGPSRGRQSPKLPPRRPRALCGCVSGFTPVLCSVPRGHSS